VVDGEESVENVGPSLPALPGDDSVGGGGMGEDANPLAPLTGERRPGGRLPSPPGPAPRAKGLRRLFGLGPKPETGTAPATKEKQPRPAGKGGRRISGAETLSDAWGGIGALVVRNPAHVPLGRYMQLQAPVAGEMLDDAAAGTVVDKVALQPIVKARGRFDLIGAVFGPPALILAIERAPERVDVLVPMLRASIRNALPLMVPALKRVQAKEAKMTEAAADLFSDDPNYREWVSAAEAQGVKHPDPADYILSTIFDGWAPPGAPAEPEPQEAPA
jgi:hypothetical protein